MTSSSPPSQTWQNETNRNHRSSESINPKLLIHYLRFFFSINSIPATPSFRMSIIYLR